MRRFGIPYPLVFAGYPVLALYAENQAILELPDLIRPMVVALAAAGLLWGVAAVCLRDAKRGAAAATVISLCLLGYAPVAKYINLDAVPGLTLSIWTVATLVLAWIAGRFWKWHALLGIFSLILFLLPVAKILLFQSSLIGSRVVDAATGGSTAKKRPDIVYVILDGYGRTDTFERLYGFSDKTFVAGLRSRGFFVADRSRANYCQTELSVGSALNLGYIQNLDTVQASPGGIRPSFRTAFESSKVMGKLRELGYRVQTIGTGFPPLSLYESEVERADDGGLNLLESALIEQTPFRATAGIWISQFEVRRRKVLSAFEKLGSLGERREKPIFTFIHILAPHPPFSFGADGEKLQPKGPFGFWDGSDYLNLTGDRESYRQGYRGQAQFVAKKVLESIDNMLKSPGPKPIIVIQGDHGPKMHLDQASFGHTDMSEVFPILNAYLVPESVKRRLYPEITPVNTFRTIFREIFGEDLPNLPDRSWYSPYGKPLEFTEVTRQLSPKRA